MNINTDTNSNQNPLLIRAEALASKMRKKVFFAKDFNNCQIKVIEDLLKQPVQPRNFTNQTLSTLIKKIKGPYKSVIAEILNVKMSELICKGIEDLDLEFKIDQTTDLLSTTNDLKSRIKKYQDLLLLLPPKKLFFPTASSKPIEQKQICPVVDIWTACQSGDIEYLRKELNNQTTNQLLTSYLNQKGDEGNTLLHIAAKHGQFDIVKVLLEKGANVLITNSNSYLPLFFAAQKGYLDIAQELIKKGSPVNAKGEYGRTAIHTAAFNGHEKMVELLLEQGADINTQAEGDFFTTPLHEAIMKQNNSLILTLLKSPRLDVNICDADKQSPLYYAVKSGQLEIAIMIVSHPSYKCPLDITNLNHLNNLIKLAPQAIRPQFSLLFNLLNSKNFQKNYWEMELSKILKNNSKNSMTFMRSGLIYSILGQYENALKMFNSIQPETTDLHFHKGYIHFKKEDYAQSITDLTYAIKKAGNNRNLYEQALYYRGLTYFKSKDYEKAIKDLNELTKSTLDSIKTFKTLGEAYLNIKNFDQAITTFETGLKKYPDNLDLYFGLGKAHEAKGEVDQAILDYSKVIELDPKHLNSYKRKIKLNSNQDKVNDVLLDIEKLTKINPTFVQQYFQEDLEKAKRIKNLSPMVKLIDELILRIQTHIHNQTKVATDDALFRVPGSANKVKKLLSEIIENPSCSIDNDYSDADLASSLKKLFMDSSKEWFQKIEESGIRQIDVANLVQAIQEFHTKFNAMPKFEKEFCKIMILFLKNVYTYYWQSKPGDNLTNMLTAMPFVKIIFESNGLEEIASSPSKRVAFLITHYNAIFG